MKDTDVAHAPALPHDKSWGQHCCMTSHGDSAAACISHTGTALLHDKSRGQHCCMHKSHGDSTATCISHTGTALLHAQVTGTALLHAQDTRGQHCCIHKSHGGSTATCTSHTGTALLGAQVEIKGSTLSSCLFNRDELLCSSGQAFNSSTAKATQTNLV